MTVSDPPRQIPTFAKPPNATVRPPGSKSETIRALAAAALARGRSHLYGPLSAADPVAMAAALHAFGVEVNTNSDPWSVVGTEGRLTAPKTPVDANESGLSARILIAMAGSAEGLTRIEGRGRLPQRPMQGIVDSLRLQGVEVSGDHIPLEVSGRGRLWGGRITVDCSESSQFATALMLVAPTMHEPCEVELAGLEGSAGYLDVTAAVMRRFGAAVEPTVTGYRIANDGYQAADIEIEPDASAAVYPMSIAAITGGRVVVEGLGSSSPQPDLRVAAILESMGCQVYWEPARVTVDASEATLQGVDVDMAAAPDGALALAVACLFAEGPSRIRGLFSLRYKESDRLDAIATEIRRIGGDAEVEGDSLLIRPGPLSGAEIDAHGDHRIAMAMATAGTRVPGLAVSNPSVVNKTWPEFWDLLDTLGSV
jgi:3-phosphoshikimate 1-carboxyvinyltransferase